MWHEEARRASHPPDGCPGRSVAGGLAREGFYGELLNTDAKIYGGSDVGNAGGALAQPVPVHGQPFSLTLTLPPLAVLVLKPEEQA